MRMPRGSTLIIAALALGIAGCGNEEPRRDPTYRGAVAASTSPSPLRSLPTPAPTVSQVRAPLNFDVTATRAGDEVKVVLLTNLPDGARITAFRSREIMALLLFPWV